MHFTIITGMSGAGKSQVIKYMEDLGFYCVDNMPPILLQKFAELCDQSQSTFEKTAIVMDIRGGEFFEDLIFNLEELERLGYHYEILFLDAGNEELIKRFKETRRSHPLAKDGSLEEGIKKERNKLRNLRQMANNIIDTTGLDLKSLKEEIRNLYIEGEKGRSLRISLTSFGFKYGIPLDSDLVFDVRFLPNPFYEKSLKEYTGDDPRVQRYVMDHDISREFYAKLLDMLRFLIPNYIQEGKNNLVVAIGCTGGRHRSVTLVNKIFKELTEDGNRVTIHHRDKEKKKS